MTRPRDIALDLFTSVEHCSPNKPAFAVRVLQTKFRNINFLCIFNYILKTTLKGTLRLVFIVKHNLGVQLSIFIGPYTNFKDVIVQSQNLIKYSHTNKYCIITLHVTCVALASRWKKSKSSCYSKFRNWPCHLPFLVRIGL